MSKNKKNEEKGNTMLPEEKETLEITSENAEQKEEKREKRKYVKADPLAVSFNIWFSQRGFRREEWFAKKTFANRHPQRNTMEKWDEIFKNY